MALVTTTEMFKKAYEGGYAIGAFNVNNMEIVQAITEAAGELLGLQVPDLHELRRPRGSEQTGVLVPPTDHRRRDLAALRLVFREYRERHERRHDPRLSDVPNKYGPFSGPFHQQRGLRGVDPLERRRARAQLRVDRRHRLILAVIEQRNRLPHPHLHETPSLHPPKPR